MNSDCVIPCVDTTPHTTINYRSYIYLWAIYSKVKNQCPKFGVRSSEFVSTTFQFQHWCGIWVLRCHPGISPFTRCHAVTCHKLSPLLATYKIITHDWYLLLKPVSFTWLYLAHFAYRFDLLLRVLLQWLSTVTTFSQWQEQNITLINSVSNE